MPINEYDAPLVVTPTQTYVSQHVDLPFAQLQNALDKRQNSYDVGEFKRNQLEDLFLAQQALKKDTAARNTILEGYESQLSEGFKNAGEDYSLMHSSLNSTLRDVKRDLSRGKLGAIGKAHAADAAYAKGLKEAEDRGDITNDRSNALYNISHSFYKGVGEADADGNYKTFSGIAPAKMVDGGKVVEELAKGWLSDAYGSENVKFEGNGKYLVKRGSSWEKADQDEIYKAIRPMLESNEALMADLSQKHMIYNAKDPKHGLNQGVFDELDNLAKFGAHKYGFVKQEYTMDAKADAYSLLTYGKMADFEEDYVPNTISNDDITYVENPLGKDVGEIQSTIVNTTKETDVVMLGLLEDNLRAAQAKDEKTGGTANAEKAHDVLNKYKNHREEYYDAFKGGKVSLEYVDDDKKNEKLETINHALTNIQQARQLLTEANGVAAKEAGIDLNDPNFKKEMNTYNTRVLNAGDFVGEITGNKNHAIITKEGAYVDYAAALATDEASVIEDSKRDFTVGSTFHQNRSAGYVYESPSGAVMQRSYSNGKLVSDVKANDQVTKGYLTSKEAVNSPGTLAQIEMSVGFGKAHKFMKAKNAFVEGKRYIQSAGSSQTAFVQKKYSPLLGRYVVDADASKDAKEHIQNFFVNEDGSLNLAELGGMEVYYIGDASSEDKVKGASTIAEIEKGLGFAIGTNDKGKLNYSVGGIKNSTKAGLNSQNYIKIPINSGNKSGAILVPENQFRSTAISQYFNRDISKAEKIFHQGKNNGIGGWKYNDTFSFQYASNNDPTKVDAVLIKGIDGKVKSYDPQQGLTYFADYIKKNPKSRQETSYTPVGARDSKTHMTQEQFNDNMRNSTGFAPNQTVVIVDGQGRAVQEVSWKKIQGSLKYMASPLKETAK